METYNEVFKSLFPYSVMQADGRHILHTVTPQTKVGAHVLEYWNESSLTLSCWSFEFVHLKCNFLILLVSCKWGHAAVLHISVYLTSPPSVPPVADSFAAQRSTTVCLPAGHTLYLCSVGLPELFLLKKKKERKKNGFLVCKINTEFKDAKCSTELRRSVLYITLSVQITQSPDFQPTVKRFLMGLLPLHWYRAFV